MKSTTPKTTLPMQAIVTLLVALGGTSVIRPGAYAQPCPYPPAPSSSPCPGGMSPNEWIFSVTFEGILQVSGNPCLGTPSYEDYTQSGPFPVVSAGGSFFITVQGMNLRSNDAVGVWLDFDGDGFLSVSERTILSRSGSIFTGLIAIPVILVGETRMRIRLQWRPSGTPDAYNLESWGNCEDYRVIVNNGNFRWSRNTKSSSLSLNGNASSGNLLAVTCVPVSGAVTLACASTLLGNGWDILVNQTATVPLFNGGLATPNGQILNMSLPGAFWAFGGGNVWIFAVLGSERSAGTNQLRPDLGLRPDAHCRCNSPRRCDPLPIRRIESAVALPLCPIGMSATRTRVLSELRVDPGR